mmetsp:Transcript_12879/g.43562  ORF Transcript_12879/g.43562 Transcript_12879/m.43562 type:complete len:113 (+) Transcript_12879:31-369(+)
MAVGYIVGAAFMSPLVFVLAAVVLSTMQRIIDIVGIHAKGASNDGLAQAFRGLNALFTRVLSGEIRCTTINVLLMAIVIALLAILLASLDGSNARSEAPPAPAPAGRRTKRE